MSKENREVLRETEEKMQAFEEAKEEAVVWFLSEELKKRADRLSEQMALCGFPHDTPLEERDDPEAIRLRALRERLLATAPF